MKKLIEYFIIKYIDFKIWIHKKKRGSTWDKFQYGILDGYIDFNKYFIGQDYMNQTIYTIIKIYAYLLLTVCVCAMVGATYKLFTL